VAEHEPFELGTHEIPLKPAKPKMPSIPRELDSLDFRDAWERLVQHRRERRRPMTPTSAERLLGKLHKWGAARAIAAIDHSIAQGWQGVFEPDAVASPRPQQQRRDKASREYGESIDLPILGRPA
jgi:hypothetical protein